MMSMMLVMITFVVGFVSSAVGCDWNDAWSRWCQCWSLLNSIMIHDETETETGRVAEFDDSEFDRDIPAVKIMSP